MRLEQCPDGGAGLVIAQRHDQDHRGIPGGQQRGQGGAAGPPCRHGVFQHRDGRVRAQPTDLAVDVTVEKRIAHHDQRAFRAH